MQKMIISQDTPSFKINKNIYGHFSEHLGRCIYEGLYVGENSPIPNINGMRTDVVNALKDIKIPVLRWPGGCFADEYHWTDGIGKKNERKKMINTHWGGVVEDNSFGTHEFFELCKQLECEPYICGNVGSGTVREMQEWVEYITFDGLSPMSQKREENGKKEPWKIKYWGVGNENWGCGGNMTAEYYANEYKRYATYLRNFSGNQLQKIACGPCDGDYHWTEVLMQQARHMMTGLSLHHYTWPVHERSATNFDEKSYFYTLQNTKIMDELITRHSTVMDKYDPNKEVGLVVDEWGIWTDVEPGTNPGFLYQQNTLRDALLSAINFDIFNKHADRVTMANIAQTVNVLQSVVLTEGNNMFLTPTYYAFKMYAVHHDAQFLPTFYDSPEYQFENDKQQSVSCTASKNDKDEINVTISNIDVNNPHEFELDIRGKFEFANVSAEILTAERVNSYNTFENDKNVVIEKYDGFKVKDGKICLVLPPKSLVLVTIKE